MGRVGRGGVRRVLTGSVVVLLVAASAASAAAVGWSIQPTRNPTGSSSSRLGGVSCASAQVCTSVGSYQVGSKTLTLAERWNGAKWSIQHTPNPTGAKDSQLGGVSCSSKRACTALGSRAGAKLLPFAERWNGNKWSIQHTPVPVGAQVTILIGVSCSSQSACVAVGYYLPSRGNERTLAERWNGNTWTIERTPNLSGGGVLDNVSCPSGGACVAVGYYQKGTKGLTLAERWNGTNWFIQHTPNPTGAKDSQLGGVSCSSWSACTAVGSYHTSTKALTLAERWNGHKWFTQHTLNPGATTSLLFGDSCPSKSTCTATGYYQKGTKALTLAERWNGG